MAERASSLGLKIKNNSYVRFKEPRTVLDSEPPKHYYSTVGDGNCFFRALSLYLTGNEESHETLRAFIIDHMEHNKEQLSINKQMGNQPSEFLAYLECQKKTKGENKKDKSFWADDAVVIAASSFLKTPIITYSPHLDERVNKHLWCTLNGDTLLGNAVYNDRFRSLNQTEKQIVLRNLSDHFEPAEF